MRKLKKWMSALLVICLCIGINPIQARAATNLPSEIYLAQEGSSTCTLSAAAMMLRSRFYKSNSSSWRSITESGIRSTAWVEGTGLKHSWTYKINGDSVSVNHGTTSGISISNLKSLLNNHSEGIVLYCGKLPHAVFLTDYEGDTFYCADPIKSYSGQRRTLASSYLGKKYGSQANILSNVTAYWYVSSFKISGGGGSSGSTSHTADGRYSGFVPFKSYAVNTGNISVYNESGTKYSNRYITGSSDLCTINAVYTDGWCQVTYPSSAEASGYFTAYTQLSEFIPNASPSAATATSGGTAYRRSSGSDTIGSISSGDRCLRVSSGNGRIQAIYPVNGQNYSKAGWVPESVFGGGNSGGSATAGEYKVPCKAYTISTGKVTVYDSSHNAYSTSKRYIDGANDLCTIDAIYTDGWCQVTYPTSSGTFTAYVPTSTFIPGSAGAQNWKASDKFTAYRRSSGGDTIGSVSSGDECVRVASENGRMQVMYPVSEQSYYKMGWIDSDGGHNPTGVIDSASGDIYSVTVAGWAFDEDDPSVTLGIHVYIGDEGIGTGVADLERKDVNDVYGCGNYHGYGLTFNVDKKFAGEQTVRVYAINVGGGTNTLIGEKKVNIGSDTEAPVISECKVTNVTSSGYTVSCKVTDNNGVDRVQFPTWTSYNDQDDIFESWQTNPAASGQKNGDIYTYQVYTSAHNYEAGRYNTHIYAYDKYGNASIDGVAVDVPVDVENVFLDQEELIFEEIGQEQTLTASIYPDDATDKTVTWKSEDSSIATVKDGVVKAVGAGETKIIATASSGATAECTVKVNEKKMTGLSIVSEPSKTEYYEGDTLDTKGLVLKAVYSDGSEENIESGFSCDPMSLTTAGKQKITVTYENQTVEFYVTVKEAPVGKISAAAVSGTPGDTVSVAIKMDENPGIIAARIKVSYDSKALTLMKAEDGGILGEYTFGNDKNANPYVMLWENGTASKDYTATGTLTTLTFKIADDAVEGDYEIGISYDQEEIYNVDLKNVKFSITNGKVTVGKGVVQQGTCGTNLKWQLNKEGVLTISGTGTMKNYTYKSEMPWYKYINDIQSVVIEDGVTSIGDYAFYGMSKLTDISIPEGVKTIGEYAFKNCAALDGVNLPSTLTKLGQSAFYGCTSLSSIAIPEGLYTVWGYTFKNCTSLAEVTLPSTLIKIDEAAFYGCKTLKTLDIPDSVSIIGIYCFKNCSSLSEVSLPEKLTQIREAAFYGTAIKTLSVPEGVTTVGPYAFKNCTALKSIELPQSLKKIDEAAFYACDHLAALNVPEKVESIGNYAFRRCEELQSVSFPESLKTIGESAFYGCGSLSELTIPEGVTSIGGYAFKSCVNLYEVTLPTTLKTLGESAFYGCTRISSMTIPENVATIGAYAFLRCSSLSEVIFTGNAPTIGDYAFAKVTADVRYPGDNSTWTEDKLQNYGGKLTWIADGGKTVAEESMETEEQIVETVESENDTVYETEVEETVQEDETTEDTQQSEETVLETEQGTDSAEEGIAESIDE